MNSENVRLVGPQGFQGFRGLGFREELWIAVDVAFLGRNPV